MTATAELLSFALELADVADSIAMRAYRSDQAIKRKPDGSFVTPADVETETALRARIAERFPEHAVLGEEEGDDSRSLEAPARWILDPIDGTHSYMRGIPVWATLIACLGCPPVLALQLLMCSGASCCSSAMAAR